MRTRSPFNWWLLISCALAFSFGAVVGGLINHAAIAVIKDPVWLLVCIASNMTLCGLVGWKIGGWASAQAKREFGDR